MREKTIIFVRELVETVAYSKRHMMIWVMLMIWSILPLPAEEKTNPWRAGMTLTDSMVSQIGVDRCFSSETISDVVFTRMQGKTWKKECPLKRSDYRYLKILHRNADGVTQMGEMICNKSIADKLVRIFRLLYEANYRIERMVLLDDYDADDERSMTDNNTSCFNYRVVKGSAKLSAHAKGLAIDINPLYNPYVKQGKQGIVIQPVAGRKYAYRRDKRKDIPYKIDHNDLAYKLFKEYGFSWGGDWRSLKDYQHFEYKK